MATKKIPFAGDLAIKADIVTIGASADRVVMPDFTVGKMKPNMPNDPSQKYDPPKFERTEAMNPRGWAEWGIDDRLPRTIQARISEVPLAAQALETKASDLHGNGLLYVSKKSLFASAIEEIEMENEAFDFAEENILLGDWLSQVSTDAEWLANSWTQFDMTKDKSKIRRMFRLDPQFSRNARQNKNTWAIEYMMFDGRFGLSEIAPDEDIKKLPLLRQWDEKYFEWLRGQSFVMHTKYNDLPGQTYYGCPEWIRLLDENSWLNVAREVPKIVHALQNYQISIKYKINVSETYFRIKYGDKWDDMDFKQRDAIYNAWVDKLKSELSGVDNYLTTLTNLYVERNGEKFGLVEIEAIDDKAKTGTWIPSSSVADNEILNALGIHASQFSLVNEGGKMGAGSGSDARVHFNSGVLRNSRKQFKLLKHLNFVARYNGWKGRFIVNNFAQTTTDKSSNGIGTDTSAPSGD